MGKGTFILLYAVIIMSMAALFSNAIILVLDHIDYGYHLITTLLTLAIVISIPYMRAVFYRRIIDEVHLRRAASWRTVENIYRLDMLGIVLGFLLTVRLFTSDVSQTYFYAAITLIATRVLALILASALKRKIFTLEISHDDPAN